MSRVARVRRLHLLGEGRESGSPPLLGDAPSFSARVSDTVRKVFFSPFIPSSLSALLASGKLVQHEASLHGGFAGRPFTFMGGGGGVPRFLALRGD